MRIGLFTNQGKGGGCGEVRWGNYTTHLLELLSIDITPCGTATVVVLLLRGAVFYQCSIGAGTWYSSREANRPVPYNIHRYNTE